MADAVAVDSWDGRGVRLADITAALADLRHQSGDRGALRTAVMTLVAIAEGDERAYSGTRALRALGGHHPARIVLVRPEPDQVATLDGRAVLYEVAGDGLALHFEEIVLRVGGQAAHHLDSLVEAFTLSDLPVVIWYVGTVPDPADPLLTLATAVLTDSRDAADTGHLRTLLELARRRTVVDMSWIRLEPWRRLLARLFDPPDARPWIDAVESVEVSGKTGPRLLLAGWLAGTLGLRSAQVQMIDARHVELRVLCRRGADTAVFEVGRGEIGRTVSAEAVLPNGRGPRQSVPLAEDPLATSLADALTHLEPDVVWERALSSASSLSA
jgi:glucose-6-phosphate dehydrogenase assembly protein OpcA